MGIQKRIDDNRVMELFKRGKLQREIAAELGCTIAGVSKRLKKILPATVPESLQGLTEKEKRFVLAKAKGATNIDAAQNAYDCINRESAKSMGSQLMKREDIQKSISDLLNDVGLTRLYRARKLRRHVDHPDPNISLKAMDQTWRLEGTYQEKPMVNIEFDLRAAYESLAEVRERREIIRQALFKQGIVLPAE